MQRISMHWMTTRILIKGSKPPLKEGCGPVKVGVGPERGGSSLPPEFGAAMAILKPAGTGKVTWPVDIHLVGYNTYADDAEVKYMWQS